MRPPSAFGITVGSPPSSTAIQLLVVPRSMPIVFAIPDFASIVGLLRKSKPQSYQLRNAAQPCCFAGDRPASSAPSLRRPGSAPRRLVRIATDTTATPNGQHATERRARRVAAGSRIVSTFQVGRYFGGAPGRSGTRHSTNAGRTWQAGLVPGITQATSPPGPSTAASDPVVAYRRPARPLADRDAREHAGRERRCSSTDPSTD